MIVIIVPLVVLVLAAIISYKQDADLFLAPLLGLAAAAIIFLPLLAITSLVSWIAYDDIQPSCKTYVTQLVQVNDLITTSGTISGSIFAISGSLGSEATYSYYAQDNRGGLHLEIIPAEITTVVQDATKPRIETTACEYATFFPEDSLVGWWIPNMFNDPPTINYRLIVPEGTIGYGFKLDGN
jgi:hypothetical protein